MPTRMEMLRGALSAALEHRPGATAPGTDAAAADEGPLGLVEEPYGPGTPWRLRKRFPVRQADPLLRSAVRLLTAPPSPPGPDPTFALGTGSAHLISPDPARTLSLSAAKEHVVLRRDTSRPATPSYWLAMVVGANGLTVAGSSRSLLELLLAAWPATGHLRLDVEAAPGVVYRFVATAPAPLAGLASVAEQFAAAPPQATEVAPTALRALRPGNTHAVGPWLLRVGPSALEVSSGPEPVRWDRMPYDSLVLLAEEPSWLHLVAANVQVSLPLPAGTTVIEHLEQALLTRPGRFVGDALFANIQRLARNHPIQLATVGSCRLELAPARLDELPVLDAELRSLFLDGSLRELWCERGARACLTLCAPASPNTPCLALGLGRFGAEEVVSAAFEPGPLGGTWLVRGEDPTTGRHEPSPDRALLARALVDAPALRAALGLVLADPAARAWIDLAPGVARCWLRGLDLGDLIMAELARAMTGFLGALQPRAEVPTSVLRPAAAGVEALASTDLCPRLLLRMATLARGRLEGGGAPPWPVTRLVAGAPGRAGASFEFGRRFVQVHDPALFGFEPGPVPGSFCPREHWNEPSRHRAALAAALAAAPELEARLEALWRCHLEDMWFEVHPGTARVWVWPTRVALDTSDVVEVRTVLELLKAAGSHGASMGDE